METKSFADQLAIEANRAADHKLDAFLTRLLAETKKAAMDGLPCLEINFRPGGRCCWDLDIATRSLPKLVKLLEERGFTVDIFKVKSTNILAKIVVTWIKEDNLKYVFSIHDESHKLRDDTFKKTAVETKDQKAIPAYEVLVQDPTTGKLEDVTEPKFAKNRPYNAESLTIPTLRYFDEDRYEYTTRNIAVFVKHLNDAWDRSVDLMAKLRASAVAEPSKPKEESSSSTTSQSE
jgi:hypothetical protein